MLRSRSHVAGEGEVIASKKFGLHDGKGNLLFSPVLRADTFLSRLKGLAFAPPPPYALLLDPCGAVHTMWMLYPLHLLYLSRAGCVLRIVRALPPWRIDSCRGADLTLEIPVSLPCADDFLATLRIGMLLFFRPLRGKKEEERAPFREDGV